MPVVITRGHIDRRTIKSAVDLYEDKLLTTQDVIIVPDSRRGALINILMNDPSDYYEVSMTDESRLFFDYDSKEPYRHDTTKTILNALVNTIQECINVYGYVLKASEFELKSEAIVRYLDASVVRNVSNNKHSLHIIFPRIVMHYKDMSNFVSLLKGFESTSHILSGIDTQVYRKNLNLRAVYSLKNGNSAHQLIPTLTERKAADYFITPDDDYIRLQSIVDVAKTNLIGYIESVFGEETVLNADSIKQFMMNTDAYSHPLSLKEMSCPLCGEMHKRQFYLKKIITSNGKKYIICKNGSCIGLSRIAPYIESRKTSNEASNNILYQIAVDILSKGDLRKTNEGIYRWANNHWSRIDKKDIGNMVIKFKEESENLSEDVKDSIEDASSRRYIIENICDTLSEYPFPAPEDSYIMFKNGLYDIDTMQLVQNSKDYNIESCLGGDFPTDETDKVYDELVFQLRKIVSPICNGLPEQEAEQRRDDWSRFKQALGGLLAGRHTTEVFHFYGKSDGGKSLVVDMILIALGSYGYKGRLDILKSKSSATDEVLADYKNKLVTVISELPADFVIEEFKLKNITEKIITADRKYEAQTTFRNRARTIIDSNYLIDVNSSDRSVRKRIQSFMFRSHFSAENQSDDPFHREFIRDDTLETKVQSGYFSNAMLRFILECYKPDMKGRPISPENRLTLIHQARSFEIKTLLDNGIIDKSSMLSTIPMLINTHYILLEKQCPILKNMLMQGSKYRITQQIALAISYLPEIENMKTPIIEDSITESRIQFK